MTSVKDLPEPIRRNLLTARQMAMSAGLPRAAEWFTLIDRCESEITGRTVTVETLIDRYLEVRRRYYQVLIQQFRGAAEGSQWPSPPFWMFLDELLSAYRYAILHLIPDAPAALLSRVRSTDRRRAEFLTLMRLAVLTGRTDVKPILDELDVPTLMASVEADAALTADLEPAMMAAMSGVPGAPQDLPAEVPEDAEALTQKALAGLRRDYEFAAQQWQGHE